MTPDPLTALIHASLEADGGCLHFEHGFGPYARCEDPDEGVPISDLPGIFAALAQPAPALDVREAALFVLRDWFECQCDEAWTARDLHAPHCYADEIDEIAEAIAFRVAGVWPR